MILTCPSCEKRFLVDPLALGPEGRTVRCAGCGHSWFQSPEVQAAPAIAPEPISSPEALSENERAAQVFEQEPVVVMPAGMAEPDLSFVIPPPVLPQKACVLWPWKVIFLLLIIVLACAAAVFFRVQLIAHVPATAKFYEKVGLYETNGLIVSDLTFNKQIVDDKERYAIKGKIVNTASVPRRLPILRFRLADKDQRGLHHWDSPAADRMLKPGEEFPFKVDRLENRFKDSAMFVIVELGNPLDFILRK